MHSVVIDCYRARRARIEADVVVEYAHLVYARWRELINILRSDGVGIQQLMYVGTKSSAIDDVDVAVRAMPVADVHVIRAEPAIVLLGNGAHIVKGVHYTNSEGLKAV